MHIFGNHRKKSNNSIVERIIGKPKYFLDTIYIELINVLLFP